MSTQQSQLIILLLLISALLPLASTQGCKVCTKCTACTADVLADTYIDDIDGLLRTKVDDIGYPLTISRIPNTTNINYQIVYSRGLAIKLLLDLRTMQVQLLDYSLNSITTNAPSSNTPSNQIKTAAQSTYPSASESETSGSTSSLTTSPTNQILTTLQNSNSSSANSKNKINTSLQSSAQQATLPANSQSTSFRYNVPLKQSTSNNIPAHSVNNSPVSASTAGLSSIINSQLTDANVADVNGNVNYLGTQYVKANSSFSNQQFFSQYVDYLAAYFGYPVNNLVGVYIHPTVASSVLFRYKASNGFISLVTTTNNIQKIISTLPSKFLSTNSQNPSTAKSNTSRNSNQKLAQVPLSQSSLKSIGQSNESSTIKSLSKIQAQSNNQAQSQIDLKISTSTITALPNHSNQPPNSLFDSNSNIYPQASTNQQTLDTVQQFSNNTQAVSITKHSLNQILKTSVVMVDPKCLCYQRSTCVRCAHRFYLNNNHCIQIPTECFSYDVLTGVCISCLPGYTLNSGLCQPQENIVYIINNQCLTCLSGYKMVNQRCVYAPSVSVSPSTALHTKNIFCFAWKDSSCVQCMPGTYLSPRGICELVDPFCSLFEFVLGVCSTCEQGYSLRNGRCFKI